MNQTVVLSLSEKISSAFQHHQAENFDAAASLYRSVLNDDRENLDALHLLGVIKHQHGANEEAVELLRRAAALVDRRAEVRSEHAIIFNSLGNALRAAGRHAEAKTAYSRGLAFDPGSAELHANLGSAQCDDGDFTAAIASYRLALMLAPSHAGALLNLACLLIEQGAGHEAVPLCHRLVAIAPADPDPLFLLGQALGQTGDNGEALLALQQCLKRDPQHGGAIHATGVTLARMGMTAVAVRFLEHAAVLRPDDAAVYAELGNALQALGDTERALACFRRHGELCPLTTWRAARGVADFSVLAMTSPGVANTPPDFLFAGAAHDTHFFSLLPGVEPDRALLRRHGDIAVNLISDADQARDILAIAAAVSDHLGKAVLNHPRIILRTGRESVAARLAGIANCRVPKTVAIEAALLTGEGAAEALARHDIAFPLLLRVPGNHGGEAFEKIGTSEEARAFTVEHAAESYYATRYVDYRSPDGHFRKYRFFLTDQDVLPYHLAIGDHWKVHHYTTNMDQHVWMQDEEKLFLDAPQRTFSPEHYAAMAEIRRRIGLDFFGIDCSLDREGNLLIFEVNASVLIHNDNADFPYKTPACLRIRDAFQAMLKRAAQRAVSHTFAA